MALLNTILDIVFPVRCLGCDVRGSDLCPSCLTDFPQALRQCPDWIFPLYEYRHPLVKKSIWLLKYKSKRGLAKVFAEAMYDRILEESSDLSIMNNFRKPILIPIPLSNKRHREWGFNQTELICKELIKINDLRHGVDMKLEKNILIKSFGTIHQAHIENRKERLKNIIGSFAIKNEEPIKKKCIILIDDVTTTGATLSEAKKVLKSYGAKKVIAFTIAH